MADTKQRAGCGCSIGGLLAVVLSWATNFFCGWLYVIYWILFDRK